MKCETCGGDDREPSDDLSHVLCRVEELESKLDSLESTKLKYDNLCNVLNEQTAEIKELKSQLDRLYSLLRKANKGMLAGEGISLAHYMRYPAEVGEPVTEEEEAELEAILEALK